MTLCWGSYIDLESQSKVSDLQTGIVIKLNVSFGTINFICIAIYVQR